MAGFFIKERQKTNIKVKGRANFCVNVWGTGTKRQLKVTEWNKKLSITAFFHKCYSHTDSCHRDSEPVFQNAIRPTELVLKNSWDDNGY